jgi:hypothetical protein
MPKTKWWFDVTPADIAKAEEFSAALIAAATRAQRGEPFDLIMPNGKRLADCTAKEVREMGEWLTRVGKFRMMLGKIMGAEQ